MATTSILLAVAAAIAFNTVEPESSTHPKPTRSDLSAHLPTQTTKIPEPSSQKNWQPTFQQGRLIAANRDSRINVRTQPSVHSGRRAYGVYGDDVQILSIEPGLDDSYRWYQVEFPLSGIRGWVREDLILEVAPRPTPTSFVNPQIETDNPTPQPYQTVFPSPSRYTAAEMSYFAEIALGSEFGNASERVRKWDDDIRIQVHGTPTERDRQALAGIVAELNTLLNQNGSDGIQVDIVEGRAASQANVDIYFVPQSDFARYEPNYQPGNMGFAYVNWNHDRIYQARVLITTEGVTQAERSHLIREELTQSLGLLRDSYRYSDSIFYQGWTSTNAFSSIDRAVIQMLYSRTITPGMNGYQARTALAQTTTVARN
ncbi:MAG: DUF2927 domain-containing protein [Leptolyngbyaceae bacterium]|nr:DUF2927 domain-containing protein [Leptolyngbyaceae bacterium]